MMLDRGESVDKPLARPYSVRLAQYKYALPQLHPLSRIMALMRDGRPVMPRFWMPMTQGLAPAPGSPLSIAPRRPGSVEEQMIPTHKTPTT